MDGKNVRDWLYVQDHCSAIDVVLHQGNDGETYLVGGLTEDVSNLDLIKMIIKLMGESENKIEFVKDRLGHDRRYSVDWSTLNKKLGWHPSVTLEEGITKTILWYKENPSWWQPLKEKSQEFFKINYQEKD